jgi:hypothetical protein
MSFWLGILLCFPQEAEISARYSLAPVEVEVGQPFTLTLALEHPAAESVFDLELADLVLNDTWVIFDESRETPMPLATSPGRSVTRWHWSLVSLEAGERRLLSELTALIADERVGAVDVSATEITVLSVLLEGEDEPRPMRGLPAGFGELAPEEMTLWQRIWPGVAAFGVLCVLLGIWRFLRRKRPEPITPALAPLAELEELRAQPISEERELRARHFALTRLVRRATDEKRGVARVGLTDAEWLLEIESDFELGKLEPDSSLGSLANELKQYLEAAEGIKYAKANASEWALEETHSSTRRILENLRQGSWPRALVEEAL